MAKNEKAKWDKLPERVLPQEWITDEETEPVPGALLNADAQREQRDALLNGG